ncbi:MAG: beta-ketoacyl-ACP synthase III [Christensenellales bacterium]|jgi:3-oxoacyl-[acyl-carrier-protein] synthase-3
MIRSQIIGVGRGVPARVVENREFESFLDTSDEWIRTRTGISARRVCTHETAASLCMESARGAIAQAGIGAGELDLIIVSTITPDNVTPSVACTIQKMLGAHRAAAFDISAGCTGFLYAAAAADQFIRTGMYRSVLVVSVDVISRVLDWSDRSTCVLFGDGSAAVVLRAGQRGIESAYIRSDGDLDGSLTIPGNPIDNPWHHEDARRQTLVMDGRNVFLFAVNHMTDALEHLGRSFPLESVDWFIPHQANVRIIDLVCKNLGIPREKFYINIDRFGNTSSASIPIALSEAAEKGLFKTGDRIALVAFGSGFTWGSMLVEWTL